MWWWVMIWLLLVLLATVYLGARTWGLWGQTKELGSELATAERRLDDVQGQLELLGERIGPSQELAVFTNPAAARKQRDRVRKQRDRARHAARQQRQGVSARRPNT